MLLVPVRSSLSLSAYLTLLKALIQVKAHTRKDGTRVQAHTRNIQSRAERRELVEALAKKMGSGEHTRHATLASAVGAARFASRANGKAVHVYEHADGGWVATHDETHTEGHDEKIVAHKGKARLHRAGEASRSLAHLKGPIAEHVEKPFVPKVKPARPKAEKKPAPTPVAPAPGKVDFGAEKTVKGETHVPVTVDGQMTHALTKDRQTGVWALQRVDERDHQGPVKMTLVREGMTRKEAQQYAAALAGNDAGELARVHQYDRGVPVSEMPQLKQMRDFSALLTGQDGEGRTWYTQGYYLSTANQDDYLLPGAQEQPMVRSAGVVDEFIPAATTPVHPVAFKTSPTNGRTGAVVFDNGAVASAEYVQRLMKLHPGASWHYGTTATSVAGVPINGVGDGSFPFVLKDRHGANVAMLMPLKAEAGKDGLKELADQVAAGYRPASIKPEKPGYEGPEGKDMTDDNAAERKAGSDLRAAVADKNGAVAKARIRLHDDVADIYAVKHPDGHITATVHWVEGQKARTQPHNSFNLEGFTSSFSGPRKWDTITAFKRDLDRKFGGKGYVHPNWRDAHYESELEVRDFSEEHARAVAIKEKRRRAEADAYRAGESGRNQSQQSRPVNLAEELARQAAVATGDRADLKHPATRKAVVDDLKKLDVHTLAPRARWNNIDPDVTGKQLTARVQLKRAVPHQMTYINPNTGENQGRLVEHDGYDLQWHPDRGVSLKNDDGKKVWSDPAATKDPVAAVKAALQAANALPDMTYKS
jgi:hypothetical protein